MSDRTVGRRRMRIQGFYPVGSILAQSGQPFPGDTEPHILCLLVNRLRQGRGPLAQLSYSGIRKRLENLVALGLIGHIPKTIPASYYPLDFLTEQVRRVIVVFAADIPKFFITFARPN